MEILILIVMLAVFTMFFAVNVKNKSTVFGLMAGIILMLLGIFLIAGNLLIPTGSVSTSATVDGLTTVNNTIIYTDLGTSISPNPVSIMGLIFIGIALYILYTNALAKLR